MKIKSIIGIVAIIAFAGVFGSQFIQTSSDTTQVNSSTEFEKTPESQEKLPSSTSTQEKLSVNTSIQEKLSSQSTVSVHNIPSKYCSGDSRCFTGTVSKIIDGDTIIVDGQSVRFALASTPELNEPIGMAAKEFVKEICPVGSKVKVDEDDGQTQGSYGRIIGVVYCDGVNLNQAVMDEGFGNLFFDKCKDSEFSDDSWSGCETSKKIAPYQTE